MQLKTKVFGDVQLLLPNLDRLVEQLLKDERKVVKRDYLITVRTWERKPDFEETTEKDSVSVTTKNKVYGYIDDGTKPHVIKAKKAPRLAFYRTGFVAKTVSNALTPRPGKRANADFSRPLEVKHPGFPARNYTKMIKKRSSARFAYALQKAIHQQLPS